MTRSAPVLRALVVGGFALGLGLVATACGGPDFARGSASTYVAEAGSEPDVDNTPIIICPPCPSDGTGDGGSADATLDAEAGLDATVEAGDASAADGGKAIEGGEALAPDVAPEGAAPACVLGGSCAPGERCHLGKVTECSTAGVATCTDQGTAGAGTSCAASGGAGGVCDGAGSCVACSAGSQCNPGGNTCQVGVQSCSSGPTCTGTTSVREGQACGANEICRGGACVACDAASCASGCCDSSGCVTTGQSVSECGAGGAACAPCTTVTGAIDSCNAGVCQVSCKIAGDTICGTACVNLQTDGDNCGACGHSCLGGACSLGQCQPFVVATGTGGFGIALVDATAYYAMNSPVLIDLNKTTGMTMGTAFVGQSRLAFAQDAEFLYVEGGDLMSAQICVVSKETLQVVGGCLYLVGNSSYVAIAEVGSQLWWIDSSNVLWKGSTTGAAASMIDTAAGNAVVADASGLVWEESAGGLSAAPTTHMAGQAVTTLWVPSGATQPGGLTSQLLVIDALNAYWFNGTDMGIYSSPRNGAAFTKLASVANQPSNLAVSGGSLYWADLTAGTVSRVSTTGGPATTIATSQSFPEGVAADATAVYWSNGFGTTSQFMRLAK